MLPQHRIIDDAAALEVLARVGVFGHIEHDRNRGGVGGLGLIEEQRARPRLYIGRIDDGEFAALQAFFYDRMQQGEGFGGGALVGFVVADQRTAGIGRDDFGGTEMAAGESRLAGTGDADQHDQRILRNLQRSGHDCSIVVRMSATPTTAPSAVAAPVKVSSHAWYALGVFMACYTLSYIDRQILSTFVDPIKMDFGVTDAQVGMLQGLAFALFYTFIGLPLGYFVDRTNRRNLIVMGVMVWSFFTASCAFATTFNGLFISRMGVGIGEATLGPAAFSLMIDMFPRQRMGVAASVFYWGNLLGAGLALLIGGAVREAAGTMAPWTFPVLGAVTGWRLVFVMLGIPGMLFSLLVLTVKEPPRTGTAGIVQPSLSDAFREIRLRWQSVAGISLAFACQAGANYGFMGWAVTHYLRQYQWGPGQTTRALGTLLITCGVGGLYFGGWISDRMHRKGIVDAPLRVAIPSAIGIAVFLAGAMIAPTPYMSLALVAPGLFLIALPMGTASAAVTYIFPNQFRGFVAALYLFILNGLGLPIGNYVPGLINTNFFGEQALGKSAAITIFACGVGMMTLVLATRRKYREHYAMIQ